MIILGKDNDDKGSQLEQIAQSLLLGRGYQNIKLNAIGPGGAEYDVTGEYLVPLAVGTRTLRVIGECKARKDPINMTDWQKFLGKVYMEQIRNSVEILGLFLTLSEVNSYVASSFQELVDHNASVSLVKEADVEEFLKRELSVCTLQQAANSTARLTKRIATMLELCYYQKACYWLVSFEQGSYTLLDATGQPAKDDNLQQVRPLVESIPSLSKFIDLNEEAEAIRKITLAQKHVIARLMFNDGIVKEESLLEASPYSREELDIAISLLSQQSWVEFIDGEVRFVSSENEDRCTFIVELLRFWLAGEMLYGPLFEGIGSDFYNRHVDARLLQDILTIQGDLPIPVDEQDRVIRVLKLSPTALLRALYPYELITNHRIGQYKCSGGDIDEIDRNLFFEYLINCLMKDFNTREMAWYYSKFRGIIELEHSQQVIFKNGRGVDGTMNSRLRRSVRPSNVQGGFIHLLVLGSHPEPWEEIEDRHPVELDFDQFK